MFLIDDQVVHYENRLDEQGWLTHTVEDIEPGHHNLIWRYEKYNSKPFTENMQAEIEVSQRVILVVYQFLISPFIVNQNPRSSLKSIDAMQRLQSRL